MESPTRISEIKLIPIGEFDQELLDYLLFALPGIFGAQCSELTAKLDATDAYNQPRRQYHSTQLLRKLHDLDQMECEKILGVTELDLFIPIFTFVFGEAQVAGSCALMSAHRLHQEFYGLPGDRALFFARAEKEAIHELGHAYGLSHCRSYGCAMRFSNSVEDVDIKAGDLCRVCATKLRTKTDATLAA